jgi:hypothetical protein
MPVYWQVTGDGFFSRVSKEQTLATESAGAEVAKGMASMRKAELAAAAEGTVRGKGWVPEISTNG